ncbi:unnamed protein product, partial [Closterium sp. Yama58-4]
FRAAREAADAIGAQMVLGDRPIEITLRRAWKALSLPDRARLASALLQGGLKGGGALEQGRLKGELLKRRGDSNSEGMVTPNVDGGVEVARQFPTLIGPLVHERDAYLAWALKRSKAVRGCDRVVGVVGRGHLPGVVHFLLQDNEQRTLRFKQLVGASASDEKDSGKGGMAARVAKRFRTSRLVVSATARRKECPSEEACIEDPYDKSCQNANDCQVAGNEWTRREMMAATGSSLAAVALAIVTSGAVTVPIANAGPATAPAPTAAGAAVDTASWKLLESAFGFSFLYPSSYIVTINRKNDPADAPLTADGAQALAVVGNFVTFDTMSVIRYAFTPNPDKLAPLIQRILPNGNLSTSLVEDTVFPNQPIIELPLDLQKILSALASPAGLSFDVITETCRGRIEEGKGGVGECVSVRGADLVQPIVRRHIGRILLSEGYLYVITASCTEARWPIMSAQLLATLQSFAFL